MKVAFVIPWYGPDVSGGAESECQRTAEHLAATGVDVEVLTTCIRDFRSDWVNHHRPGVVRYNGVAVRRFRANPRQPTRFDYVNVKLMNGMPVSAEEEEWYIADAVRSQDMEDYIAGRGNDYRFVFIPYLFGTTYWGSQRRPGQSFIIPCLHDESYARLRIMRPMFRSVRGVILHSRPERALAQELYGLPAESCFLLGEGVDGDQSGDAARFRRAHNLDGPFVLYVGRKDAGKNIGLLLDYFARYRLQRPSGLQLVLIGAGSMEIPTHLRERVHDLGYVSPAEKADAYAAATVLVNPSRNESFSLVVMEAWLQGTPSLVHAGCAVTVDHCRAGCGGLYFADYPEFAACLDWFLENRGQARRMGALGGQYVRNNYSWNRVTARLRRVLLA